MAVSPPDAFADVAFDAERYARDLERPGPRKTYAVFFTPRSGSTWLGRLLEGTGALGIPREWFSPQFVPGVARRLNADTIERYVEVLKRRKAPNGVFSFEITYPQITRTFCSRPAFVRLVPPSTPVILLTRQDIVAQAISLAKAVHSGRFHSWDAVGARDADRAFEYDPAAIGSALDRIVAQERMWEKLIAKAGYRPLCLTYEAMVGAGPEQTVAHVSRFLDEPARYRPSPDLPQKIGNARDRDFADRYRREHASAVEAAEAAGLPVRSEARRRLPLDLDRRLARLWQRVVG